MAVKPICSIVLVSYNNFDTCTGPCLRSLLGGDEDIECVVVDNNSDSYTRDQLKAIATTDSRLKVLFNKNNRGYAGGNNDGVVNTKSDILILLNNDTLVPIGAMTQLAQLLTQNPTWDMLGPVTNSCGNEQQIHTSSTSTAAILHEGELWCKESNGLSFTTDILGFFCVAMKKEVYEELSGLDEAFGLGFYEDTDFCYRAKISNKEMRITEDTFVYHQGSATFSKQPAETKRLMKVNHKLFTDKHKSSPNTLHARTKNADILELYRTYSKKFNTEKPICYRAFNRLQVAHTLRPNSPFKRLLYWRRLKPLQSFFNRHCSQ